MALVEVDGVSKTYDRTRYVLQDVSFRVAAGEIAVLMGRSGSGKTTLLNLVAGLDTPTKGRVVVDGLDVGAMDEAARTEARLRRVGIVFQRFHLIPELTVEENVRLPLRLARRRDAKARTRTLLDFFGLGAHAHAFPATLSGGETQRTALARALANEPAVVLADEPTANLDDGNARVALGELRRVADELGTAVVLATHDELARAIGDRVHQLHDGRLAGGARVTPTVGRARG